MKLTIAVCTYRRFDWLRKCINSLRNQTLTNNEFEILIIDNSLLPAESALVRESLPEVDNLEYVITEKSGLSFARNLALQKCGTPYIAYIDDDAIAAPNWADEIVRCFDARQGLGAVGGRVDPIWEAQPPIWLQGNLEHALAVLDWGDDIVALHPASDSRWLVGANIAYRASALREAGGFSEALGRSGNLLLAHEELAVNVAVEELGYDVIYCPSIRVDHLIQKERVTVEWFLKNAFYEGASRCVFEHPNAEIDSAVLARTLSERFAVLASEPDPEETTDEIWRRHCDLSAEGQRVVKEMIGKENSNVSSLEREYTKVLFIVTPSRNAVATIDQTILSVVSQAGNFAIRYHIQDGGSTDGTLERIAEWRRLLRSGKFPIACKNVVLTYTATMDSGIYDAIMKGFSEICIPVNAWMTWINADDVLMQNAFATVIGSQRDIGDRCRWIGQSQYVINGKGERIANFQFSYPKGIIAAGICDGQRWPMIQQEGTFWLKSLWDQVGGINTGLQVAGDWDLWRRFAQHADLLQIPWVLAVFRKRAGQLSSHDGGSRYIEEIDRVVSPDERSAEFVRIVESDGQPLNHSEITVDYNTEKYDLLWQSARNRLPAIAADFLDARGIQRRDDGPTKYGQAAIDRGAAVEQASDSSLLGNVLFRRVYSLSPALVKKGFRVTKYSFLLPVIESSRPWRMRRTIASSGLFLSQYYLECHPEVSTEGVDPIDHYLCNGFAPGFNPNPVFDSAWYSSQHPGLQEAGVSPLYHYIKVGAALGVDPSPEFSVAEYCAKYPQLDITKENLLLHYFSIGILDDD